MNIAIRLKAFFLHWTVLTIVFSSLLVNINPFNLNDITAYISRDIFYRVWAVEYPTEKSPKTAVVILREESLNENEVWPVKYEKHAGFLRALLPLEPKAVFFDMTFFDRRNDSTIKTLLSILEKYESKEIPIYIAAAESKTGARTVIRPEFNKLIKTGAVKLVSILQDDDYGRVNSYVLKDKTRKFESAAYKLYKDLCVDIANKQCQDISIIGNDALEIWWALPPAQINCRSDEHKYACENISQSVAMRFIRLLFKGLLPFLNIQETDPVPTSYQPTFYWEDILNGKTYDQLRKGEVFKNAVVFYGLDLALIKDEAYNPVYYQNSNNENKRSITGIYFHAMAFDNLMAMGSDFISPNPAFNMSEYQHSVFVIILTVIFGATTLRLVSRYSKNWELIWLILSFSVFPLFLAWFEFAFFKVSPGNWISGITFINLTYLSQRGFLLEWLKGVFNTLLYILKVLVVFYRDNK